MGGMTARSNESALRSTLRALKRDGRLAEHQAALVTLCESTARALDAELASDGKRYVVPQLARAHLLALQALLLAPDLTERPGLDAFDRLVLQMGVAMAGEQERASRYQAGERWPDAETCAPYPARVG